MFKFKSKRVVYYRKEQVTYRIEFVVPEDEEEARIIKKIIKDLSVKRKVFVEINGDMSAIDKSAIIRMETDPKYQFGKKLEIFPEKIENIDIPELLENVWTYFYFFNGWVNWEEFIDMRKVNLHFKRGNLVAGLYLHDMEGILIEIGENYSYHMDELFKQLQQENYIIKKRL